MVTTNGTILVVSGYGHMPLNHKTYNFDPLIGGKAGQRSEQLQIRCIENKKPGTVLCSESSQCLTSFD